MTDAPHRPDHLPPAPSALWDWIEKRDINQREAARILGFPWMTLNHYLHGRRRPSLERLERIFVVTGIPIASWLEPHVGKSKKPQRTQAQKRQHVQGGNVHAS